MTEKTRQEKKQETIDKRRDERRDKRQEILDSAKTDPRLTTPINEKSLDMIAMVLDSMSDKMFEDHYQRRIKDGWGK